MNWSSTDDMPGRLHDIKNIGLTSAENPLPSLTDEPRIPAFTCEADVDNAIGLDVGAASGLGINQCEATARIKAHAECLEAICLLNAVRDHGERRRFRPGSEDLDPADFILDPIVDGSLGRTSHEAARAAELRWTPATDLIAGSQIMVPSQLIALDASLEDEVQLRPERISTGAAFGPSGTGMALRSALLELAERDASYRAFYERRALAKIIELPSGLSNLTDYLIRYRLEPHLFDVTAELDVPAVLAITLDRTGLGPAVTAGVAADTGIAGAATKALLESLQGRSAFRLWQAAEDPGDPDPADIGDHQDRAVYWSLPERIAELDFWLETGASVSFDALSTPVHNVDDIMARFTQQNCRLAMADITLPQVRDAGFEVIKIVSPDLYPGHAREGARSMAGRGDPLPHPF